MFARLFLSFTLLVVPLSSAQAQTETPSPWNLTFSGGGMVYGQASSVIGTTLRVGHLFSSSFEGGFKLGSSWRKGSVSAALPQGQEISDQINSQNFNAGLDLRWYPWEAQSVFQPFLVGALDLDLAQWLIPSVGLGLGANWQFMPNLGLTAQVLGHTNVLLDPSVGIRYRF